MWRNVGGCLLGLALGASACGGGAPAQTHAVKADIGGDVVYLVDPSERLAGVVVTLTDVGGATRVATTNSNGLWTMTDLQPGAYSLSFAKAGYEPYERGFAIEAFGPDDVRNPYVPVETVFLEERRLRAAVSGPFEITLMDGDVSRDGYAGVTAVYSQSADGPLTVTMTDRVIYAGYAVIQTSIPSVVVMMPSETSFLFLASSLDALAADTDPVTVVELRISVNTAWTPIHGDVEQFDATLYFNVVP